MSAGYDTTPPTPVHFLNTSTSRSCRHNVAESSSRNFGADPVQVVWKLSSFTRAGPFDRPDLPGHPFVIANQALILHKSPSAQPHKRTCEHNAAHRAHFLFSTSRFNFFLALVLLCSQTLRRQGELVRYHTLRPNCNCFFAGEPRAL